MHFSFKLLFLTIAALLVVTDAVNLTQYKKIGCRGKATICRNIKPKVCCVPRHHFESGKCTGCKSTNSHITWTKRGKKHCGGKAASTHGNRCISGGSKLSGHSWCKKCPKLARRNDDDAICISTVEPDAIQIGDKWFDVNDSMPGADRDALWNMWNDETPDETVPATLLKYKTQLNETETPDEDIPGEDAPDVPEETDDFD